MSENPGISEVAVVEAQAVTRWPSGPPPSIGNAPSLVIFIVFPSFFIFAIESKLRGVCPTAYRPRACAHSSSLKGPPPLLSSLCLEPEPSTWVVFSLHTMDIKRLNSGYEGYLPSQSTAEEHLHARSDTFYGRLGSIAKDGENDVPPGRRVSFDPSSSFRRLRVRVSYDEEAYPGGLDIDMFALLFDESCTFVDCIFYKHPEDASGSFSLNQKTNSVSIDLERVPDTCHTIVLATAVYTTGMSLTELENGIIEISEGFLGPVLFSVPLQSLEHRGPPGTAAGLLFFSLSEFGGKWRCRQLEHFCKPELSALMKVAKEEAQNIEKDFVAGDFRTLRTLDIAARMSETSSSSSSRASRPSETGRTSISLDATKVKELNKRISASRRGEVFPTEDEMHARLASAEAEQRRMEERLSNIEEKLNTIIQALKE
ncbi:hypothetical protein Esti_004930 [Eimeria stiedai]